MRSWLSVMAVGLAAATDKAGKKDTCLALALNGGGSKGAYQAGVIYGFMHEGNPDDFQWDVVTGISGGAINACGMSVWAPEDGLKMSEWLSDTWNGLSTKRIWQWYPGGPLAGFKEPGIMDDTPLIEWVRDTYKSFDNQVKRSSIVGTVDANHGHYQTWKIDEIPADVFEELGSHACASSASLPGLFIP